MIEQIIEIEAETLEEAIEKVKSQIPADFHLLSEEIISDGKSIIKTKQAINFEAETLEEARERVKSQMPEGFQPLSEKIVSNGKPKIAKAIADTTEAAFAKALSELPSDVNVLEKKELIAPEQKMLVVEAFDEQAAISNAKSEARKQFGNASVVKSLRLVIAGKKGFLGMGKSPNQYEAQILAREATVEISYKLKAKISVEIGDVYKPQAKISARVVTGESPLEMELIKLHGVITAMCANPRPSFNKKVHAASLYALLPISRISKDVADLFVEVTTFIAALTGVRTTESMDALKKLCGVKNPVVNNLLHCIAKMSDAEHTTKVFDFTGTVGSGDQVSKVSFESQRNTARAELAKRGSPEYDLLLYPAASSGQASEIPSGVEQLAPVKDRAESSTLRLADPAHPARKQLEEVTKIVDQYVQIKDTEDRPAMIVSAPTREMENAVSILDEAITLCPDDMDLLVAKASVLHASTQFKSAEEVLDIVLSKTPDHFEAKMWKSHWETWSDTLRFPKWDERLSSLHPVMATHLRLDHRVQIVRDGMQKTLAIVMGIQGPPFDSRTKIKVEWVLSKTLYGPLVAYYYKIIEPSGEPSIQEAFLPIFQPTVFSPMENYFLVQQLAFTPYCVTTLVSGNTVMLNCRIVFGPKTIRKIREIASQLASEQAYLPQNQFQNAVQWHMNNFDMKQLTFE